MAGGGECRSPRPARQVSKEEPYEGEHAELARSAARYVISGTNGGGGEEANAACLFARPAPLRSTNLVESRKRHLPNANRRHRATTRRKQVVGV